MHKILEFRKREAENELQVGRFISQNNALKTELAESKRQVELKSKEDSRFPQEFSATKQAAGKSQEAAPKLKEQLPTQAAAGPGISYRIFICKPLMYIDNFQMSLSLFENMAVLSNITQCHFM